MDDEKTIIVKTVEDEIKAILATLDIFSEVITVNRDAIVANREDIIAIEKKIGYNSLIKKHT